MNKKSTVFFLLFIITSLFAKNYKGAELRTAESYVYGRFEICYKSVKGTGVLANFFTYHDFTTTTADWNEVDIEILGRYSDDLQFTTITPYQSVHNSHTYVDFNPADDYHVYAFEWTPDYVAWFVDGNELYRQTGEHVSTLTRPQKIMMNIWAPDGADSWTGEWNPDILPLFAYYDWVSYAAYMPGVGDQGTDDNFIRLWRDDFDSLNTERWRMATHTWGGNRVDFTPENVLFKDGKLILCLTRAEYTGLTDVQPPIILWARAENNKVNIRFSEEIDSLSAVNMSNYGIPGLEIQSAELLMDNRTVSLKVSDIESGKEYTLAAFNIKDRSTEGNIQPDEIVQIINNPPLSFPLGINVGGEAIYKNKYIPDQIWSPEVEYGRMDGWAESWNTAIAGTDEDSLYQSGCSEIVKYKLRVPEGTYALKLLMAENRYSETGQRIFSITVEGSRIVTDLDLVKEAGRRHAYEINVPEVQVSDGILDIHFSNWVDKPLLNGILLDQESTKLKGNGSSFQPGTFNVGQNYPNPFNPVTFIEYELPGKSQVSLTLYNSAGQILEKKSLGFKNAGRHQKKINVNLASGIYFYKITAAAGEKLYADVKKMVVLK